MEKLTFAKATKEQAKLRLALFGPSGSGKTYTALRLAAGMGGGIALIDTERGSASKYADRFTFDVLELPARDIDTYCQAIEAAAGYDVLIVDSLTHAWQQLLDEVDRIAKAKYRGNTWAAWSEGTPRQRKLVNAILNFDGHIIATMRVKTEWVTDTDKRGRAAPKRVGLAPQQGKGIEYEFDLLMELSPEHVINVLKDRTGKFQDRIVEKPGEDLGKELAAWLMDGAVPKKKATRKPRPKPTPKSPPHPNGNSGKKKANGHSWPALVVQAVIREKLAENTHNAVGMLNLSTLDPGDAEDVILNWAQIYRNARATAESKEAALTANVWLAGEMGAKE